MTVAGGLVVDEELARSTTRYLVGKLEAVALIVQAAALTVTATVDRLTPGGRILLYGIAAAHILVALLVFRMGGPFRWGIRWISAWLGMVFLMPLIMANLVGPIEYATSPTCVQLCGYPSGAFIILSFYPWAPLGRPGLRLIVESSLFVVLLLEYILLVLTMRGEISETSIKGIFASVLGNTLAFGVGKAVGVMCGRAARAQLQRQRDNYDQFANYLHSHVRGCLVAVQGEMNRAAGTDGVLRHLRRLDREVTHYRLEMLLAQSEVSLASIMKEHISRFERGVTITDSPRVGALTVARPVGLILSRALGDMLSNATEHARSVRIGFEVDGGRAVLDVTDDGPGCDPQVFDRECSLWRLRRNARRMGGDLILSTPGTGTGACFRLAVPLHVLTNQE